MYRTLRREKDEVCCRCMATQTGRIDPAIFSNDGVFCISYNATSVTWTSRRVSSVTS